MMSNFDSRSQVLEGTPQKLEECFKNKPPLTEAEMSTLMHISFNKRKNEFANFLPVLVRHGANVNTLDTENYKRTILMTACQYGYVDIVAKMLQLGADLNLKDSQNRSALFYCIDNNKEEGVTLLHMILDRNPDLVLMQMTQVTSEASNRKTLLIHAIEKTNMEMVRVLLERGANIQGCLEDTQETPLHIAVRKYRRKADNSTILAIISILLDKKVNPVAKTKTNKTALDMCPDEQSRKAIQDLISSSKDEDRRKPTIVKLPSQEVGREMIKSWNNVIKSNQKKQCQVVLRLNDRIDQKNLQIEAAAVFEQHITDKQRKYEQERRREERKREQQELQKNQQLNRSLHWIVPPPILKFYLEEEITIFTQQIEQQNKLNKEYFDELIRLISESLESTLGVSVTIYGSFATRLCLKQSDIDVVIIPGSSDDRNTVDLLEKIDNIVKALDFVSQTKFIRTAFIPVIKVSCSEHYKNKRIDITLQDANHNGLNCVDIIKQYMNEYVQLRPLAFVLKTFIYSSSLYDTYQGGLSSYGLILMIVAFLQREYCFKKPDEKLLVSELLIKFLRFFGYEFDYVKKCIYVEGPSTMARPQNYIVPQSMYRMDISPKLVLLDPLNINNNVGRSTHQIKLIQMAFCFAYTSIQSNYSCRQPDCQYRVRINALKLPKDIDDADLPKPCCILKRMFQCAKNIM